MGVEVARALDAPLGVLLVRKIGAPGQPEVALGAIADLGGREVSVGMGEASAGAGMTGAIPRILARERAELDRRRAVYGAHARPDVRGRRCILVDDGIATGATMLAALRAVRLGDPAMVLVAVPVAAAESIDGLAAEADALRCLFVARHMSGVGAYYDDFAQVDEGEALAMLDACAAGRVAGEGRG